MASAIALGGFTGPEADTLGYAIRKKKSAVLRSMKDKFVTQAAERGVAAGTIDAVFKAFEPFERYGFNKAHATCYGLIAYQTAYLKANYTVEYMASVLTAFRDNTDKVAAAIAECRRLGITVNPPDVHLSGLHFTVEGEAIRFGLLAIKNVGEGAIESIILARETGPFRSLADLCQRVDLRLVNKRVLESLVKVGGLSALGHPAQLLLALDDAIAYGQAQQRDRVSGQVSLFDSLGTDEVVLERPLPHATPAGSRERLRWEKELIGLYLSDHPLGELAAEMGRYANAYSGDMGEELDQQRIAIGGVVTGLRRVVTKSRSTMAVVTIEDLQGSLEVVVFPKVFEETMATWTDDAVLLVAGRVDHKGDETVLLADAVWTWDQAVELGPDGFTRAVAAGDRPRRGGRDRGSWGDRNGNGGSGGGGNRGNQYGNGNGHVAPGPGARPVIAVSVGPPPVALVPPARPPIVRTVAHVSPLRGGGQIGTLEVTIDGPSHVTRSLVPLSVQAVPLVPVAEPPPPESIAGLSRDGSDEPPWPEEARASVTREASAATLPVEASDGQVLHVRFKPVAAAQVEAGFQSLREMIHARPGSTRVVLHIPAGPGREQEMTLRVGVAYDAELVGEATRRIGALAELHLA